jgi:hypothetical protein
MHRRSQIAVSRDDQGGVSRLIRCTGNQVRSDVNVGFLLLVIDPAIAALVTCLRLRLVATVDDV